MSSNTTLDNQGKYLNPVATAPNGGNGKNNAYVTGLIEE